MHIMVDLETMGSTPGSIIASIGAVAFDPMTGKMGAEFYTVVNIASAQAAGLRFDADTVSWWLKQGEEARSALSAQASDLRQALLSFSQFWVAQRGTHFWGHGANFDEPLLSSAFRALRIDPPWKFFAARCTRTIFELADVKTDRTAGTHHNALDEAK